MIWGYHHFKETPKWMGVQKWKIISFNMFYLLSKGDLWIECWLFVFLHMEVVATIGGPFGWWWPLFKKIEKVVTKKPTNETWWLDFQGIYVYISCILLYIYICISIYTQKIQRILIPRIRTLTNPWCGAFDAEHGNSTHKIEVSWVVGISIYILMYTWISRISYTRCWWKKSGQPVEVDSLSQHLQGFWFISQVVV